MEDMKGSCELTAREYKCWDGGTFCQILSTSTGVVHQEGRAAIYSRRIALRSAEAVSFKPFHSKAVEGRVNSD